LCETSSLAIGGVTVGTTARAEGPQANGRLHRDGAAGAPLSRLAAAAGGCLQTSFRVSARRRCLAGPVSLGMSSPPVRSLRDATTPQEPQELIGVVDCCGDAKEVTTLEDKTKVSRSAPVRYRRRIQGRAPSHAARFSQASQLLCATTRPLFSLLHLPPIRQARCRRGRGRTKGQTRGIPRRRLAPHDSPCAALSPSTFAARLLSFRLAPPRGVVPSFHP